MKYPKVLVGAPTYEGKEYSRDAYVKNIQNLDYPNYRWCLVDNTKHGRYFSKLRRLHPANVARVPRGENSRDGIANSMNYLRRKALDEDYDYLMVVESDLFPEPETLRRLLLHNKPVVGHPYYIGFGADKHLCVFVVEQKGALHGTRALTPQESQTFCDGSLKQVHGMGVGCVLIHRDILAKYPFWYSKIDNLRLQPGETPKHPDVYFYLDLWNDGVPVMCDTSYVVPHDNVSWHLVDDA
jgi:hypothetical protein